MAPQTTGIGLLNRLYGRFNARDIPACMMTSHGPMVVRRYVAKDHNRRPL